MNAPLRRVAISVLVLFTLLIVNVNYIQVVRSEELRADAGNRRVISRSTTGSAARSSSTATRSPCRWRPTTT